MKIIKKNYFLIILAIYSFSFAFFLGKIFVETIREPILSENFRIPNLAVNQLINVSAKLEQREELPYPEKLDLTKIEFGKTEPFNP